MQKNSVNKAIIAGRLGQDPELKYTPSQTAICNFSMATTGKSRDTEITEWHRVTVFGKTAEFVSQYMKKGDLIYVEGRLQTRSWEDRDGGKRYTTEIIAQTVTPLCSAGNYKVEDDVPQAPVGVPDEEEPLPF